MKNGLTKRQSAEVQGIAILLMLCHHFFLEPEAYGGELSFFDIDAVRRLAWFAKICVSLFAFVSGYGMFYVLKRREESRFFPGLLQNYKTVFQRLLVVYRKYWLAFLLLPGVEFLIGRRQFYPKEFFANFFALSSSYQTTWWYMGQYGRMLLLLPLLAMLLQNFPDRKEKRRKIIFYGSLLSVAGILIFVGFFFCPPLWNMLVKAEENLRISFLLCFFEGYVIARFRIDCHIQEKLHRLRKPIVVSLAVILLILTVAVRVVLTDFPAYARIDFLLVSFLVYAVLTLLSYVPPLESVLAWFGRHSTYMWLLHGGIFGYLSSWLCRYVHRGWLFYLCMLALSTAAAWLLDTLVGAIKDKITLSQKDIANFKESR